MKRTFLIIPMLFAFTTLVKAQTDTTAFAYQKPLFDFDPAKPSFKLSADQQNNESRMLRYSLITGYREGVQPISAQFGVRFQRINDPSNGTAKIVMYNTSIPELLYLFPLSAGQLVLEVNDPSKYVYNPSYGDKLSWNRKNTYCLEFTMPAEMVGEHVDPANMFSPYLYTAELEDFFGVKGVNTKRMMKTLVLVRTSKVDKIKSKGVNTGQNGTMSENGSLRTNLIGNLATPLLKAGLRMVDETGYTDAVDMDLNISDWSDVPALRKSLQRYDLDIKEEMRERQVFVVTENGYQKK